MLGMPPPADELSALLLDAPPPLELAGASDPELDALPPPADPDPPALLLPADPPVLLPEVDPGLDPLDPAEEEPPAVPLPLPPPDATEPRFSPVLEAPAGVWPAPVPADPLPVLPGCDAVVPGVPTAFATVLPGSGGIVVFGGALAVPGEPPLVP